MPPSESPLRDAGGTPVPRSCGTRQDRQPASCSRKHCRRRIPDRTAPLTLPRLQHRLRRAPARTCRATTSVVSTGSSSPGRDRHYIKLFEADTNANFAVLLDVSASMSYGSHEAHQARLRPVPGSLPLVLLEPATGPGRAGHVRSRDRRLRSPFDEAPRHDPAQARSCAEAGRPGPSGTEPLLKITELSGSQGRSSSSSRTSTRTPKWFLAAIGPLRARGGTTSSSSR